MARYQIEDSETGTTLVVEGDAPPTEQDASELFAHARKSNPQVITPDQWAGMSERAARDEQNRLAGNAMNEAGTGLTQALYQDLPAAIGQGLYDVGNVAYEGGVAAMQHGIEEIAGLPADTEQTPGLTTDQAIRKYPKAVQAGIRGGEGLIRSTPQMAIAAVNPYAGALAFGFTPEGFSPKNAAIAAALPFIGSKVGAVVENMAAQAGVSGAEALTAFGKIGGAAGAAGFIGADEAYHISQLPEEEQGDAWIAAAGNVGSMFLLGMMGHSERLKNTDKVLADRASANAETMRGIERDFNRRNAGPAEEGADVPTWEGTTPRQSLEPKVLSPESPTRATRPATQDSIPEPRPTEMEYEGGEMPGETSKFQAPSTRPISSQTITGSNVRTGTEMPVQPQPASVGGRAAGGATQTVKIGEIETNEALRARTTPGESFNTASKQRAEKVKELQKAVRVGDVLIDEDGVRRVVMDKVGDDIFVVKEGSGKSLNDAVEFNIEPGMTVERSSSPQGTGTEMPVQPQPASVGGRAAGAATKVQQTPEPKTFKSIDDLLSFRNKRLTEERQLYIEQIGLDEAQAKRLQDTLLRNGDTARFEKTLTPEQATRLNDFFEGPFNQKDHPFQTWEGDSRLNPESVAMESDPSLLSSAITSAVDRGVEFKVASDRFLSAAIAARRLADLGFTKSDVAKYLDKYTTRESSSQGDKAEYFKSLGTKVNKFLEAVGINLPDGELGTRAPALKSSSPQGTGTAAAVAVEVGDTALYQDPSRPDRPPVKVAVRQIRQLPNDAEPMAEFDYFGSKRVPVSKLTLADKSQAAKMRALTESNKASDARTRAASHAAELAKRAKPAETPVAATPEQMVNQRQRYWVGIKRGLIETDNGGTVRLNESNVKPQHFDVWHELDGKRELVSDPAKPRKMQDAQEAAVQFALKQPGKMPAKGGDVTIQQQSTVPKADVTTPPQSAPAVKRVASGLRARKVFDRETELGGPDILSFIQEFGGMQSKTEANRSRGKEWWAQNKSLYDDATPLQRPQHNIIYGGKSYPDQIAQAAYDAKVLKSPDVNELWIRIREASNRRAKAFSNVREQETLLKNQEEWHKATQEGELRITPEELLPGDTFEVDGERFKVERFDKTTGDVIIQDGPRFGRQRISSGESIWVENAGDALSERIADAFESGPPEPAPVVAPKLRAGEKGTGDLLQGEDAPFNLAGERATDGERIAAAKAQAAATARAAAEFAAKNQQDMFGARGTSAVGDPMMPPIPPGVPSGVHSSGRMPVAMERIVPGQVDIPTIMDAMENVVRAVGAESPIRTGRFYAQARGIFKTFDKVIRLRAADNIPTAAHEVAHAVSDAVFGSSGSAALMRAMKPSPLYKQAVAELRALGRALYGNTKPAAGYTAEGFSELTRLWLTTENAAKSAPHAAKWLESELFAAQPELKRSMTAARDLVDVWRGQGAEGRAAAQSKGQDTRFEQLKKIAKEYLGKQAQVEEFAPLEELSRGFERISGKRLAPSQDPFMLATANRGVAGHILENFVERGVQDIWGNRTGPSLKEAFARLKPVDAENFRNYLWSRRALERWGKGKNPGMTLEDATYLKNKLETPAFIDAASKWYQWWDGVLEYVKAASPATNGPLVDAIRAGSKDYVPLARVLPESAQRAAQSRMGAGMMKMHGSGLPVREIYLQSLLTAERLISRAHKDMVLDSVFKLSQTEGMGWLVERVPRTKVMEGLNIEKIRQELEGMGVDTTAIPADTLLKYASHMDRPTGSDPIMVRVVNGKPEWYQVPAGLFDLLQGVDAPRLGKVADLFLGVPNRMFKMGTTGLRASFSLVTNPLRDLPTFMHQSLAGNPASRMAEYIGSLKDIVQAGLTGKESANWQTFKQLGIGGGTFLGGDIRQAQREVKGLFRGKVFRRLASPVETLREALSFTESAPRLAEMNLVGKESGWKPGARLTPDQAVAMKVAAKRVTTDFSAGGRVGKMVNQAVPFYNAVIQGTRSFGRAFQKEQGFKTKDHAAAKATLTGLALLTLPTIYNWWRNKDEEWYRNLPWRERYLYTNVDAGDGTIVQVPRPAEWGNVFQVVPEILLDSWYQRDPVYLKEGLKHIFATQNPLDYPVLLKLAKEQWSNRIDFFDKPIVPRGELDLPPGQQRAYFSSIIAKSLGDAFPNTVSPRRVDAAVRGIFGGVGSDLADAPGAMMRMMGIKDSGVRESEPADIPVMGRLFRRGGDFSANGKYLADFWDSYMQHQALLKGNTHSLKAGNQPTATSKELVSARILTAYHAAIKLQMEMAARATEQEDRRRLYKQATETARRALEATK